MGHPGRIVGECLTTQNHPIRVEQVTQHRHCPAEDACSINQKLVCRNGTRRRCPVDVRDRDTLAALDHGARRQSLRDYGAVTDRRFKATHGSAGAPCGRTGGEVRDRTGSAGRRVYSPFESDCDAGSFTSVEVQAGSARRRGFGTIGAEQKFRRSHRLDVGGYRYREIQAGSDDGPDLGALPSQTRVIDDSGR